MKTEVRRLVGDLLNGVEVWADERWGLVTVVAHHSGVGVLPTRATLEPSEVRELIDCLEESLREL